MHTDLTAVLRLPKIEQRLQDLVVNVAPTGGEEFAQFIRVEIRWARVIEDAGIPQQQRTEDPV